MKNVSPAITAWARHCRQALWPPPILCGWICAGYAHCASVLCCSCSWLGGGGCLPSWAASHSLPSPGGKSLRPGCSVLRGTLRGAPRVPVVPPSRGVALGCIGQEDSPLPGGSEILLECWLLSGVINWPLSRFRSKTSPQTEPFSLREEIGDSEEKLWP